jgi:high-affinity nickel permease
MPESALGLLLLGFVLGLRHALDVDHLAAVSTIVSGRRTVGSASLVGVVWGLGHTAALLAAGVVVIGLHAEIPPGVARGLELGVAVMLVWLGANLLWTLWRGGGIHLHAHVHGGHEHVHLHVHDGARVEAVDHHHHAVRAARRPFAVGVVHGLAGSAGLMLAILATIPSPSLALAYVGVFGAGSVVGMVAMSALLGLPLVLAADRFARVDVALRTCAGVGSIAVGLALGWRMA